MRETALILSQEQLQEGIWSLVIRCEAAKQAKAGQFVSLYLHNGAKILPRPISICEILREEMALRLVYRVAGEGTREISSYQAGDGLEILGPLGNGFAAADLQGKTVLLVGGGIGIPPMVGLAEELSSSAEKPGIISVMGYRDRHTFLTEELSRYGTLHIATDDGSLGVHGTVVDALREKGVTADIAFACGPKPMLKGLREWAREAGVPLYVSMEERMACGIGACLACVCKTTETDGHSHVKNARVCKDGPVFYAEDLEL